MKRKLMAFLLALVMVSSVLVTPGFAYSNPQKTSEVTDAEIEAAQVSLQIAKEGVVLLENNNGALPIAKEGDVALFGLATISTVKGGGGSGSVNNRIVYADGTVVEGSAVATTILDGFVNAGYNVLTKDHLDALREVGAQLVFFSPLHDAALPQNLDALYIGGGFPEVFRERLAANRGMRESIRRALEGGLRCYAECGGLLYLSRELEGAPMAGFLPAQCRMTERLQRFGYVWVEERTGLRFPAHEFHHALAEAQAGARLCYTVTKASDPAKSWACGFERGNTLAAFAHVFFADRPELMRRFFGL